ncbi:MAG: HDOD domain-containing protein [Myxococcota bacterium]
MSASFSEIIESHIEANRTELPVFDGTSLRVQQLANAESIDVPALEAVIEQDPVLASAALRMANSPFYGGLSQVDSVRDAVVRLGAKRMAGIAVVVALKSNYRMKDRLLQEIVAKLWNHAVACSLGARWLAGRIKRRDLADSAFMAGMLHDIGKLLVLRVIDELTASRPDFDPPEGLVREMLVKLHTRCGGDLLEKWSLPALYARVAQHHHDPDFADDDELLLVVRLVDQACNKLGIGIEPQPDLNLAASAEAQVLGVSEVIAAELEIQLEDAQSYA